jgi:hypothetical protein
VFSLSCAGHVCVQWSMSYQLRCNGSVMTDLWLTQPDLPESAQRGAVGYNNSCTASQAAGPVDPAQCQPGQRGDHWWGGYEDSVFEQQVLGTIDEAAHDPRQRPLFLMWAPHIVHAPLQAPQEFLDELAFIQPTDQVGAKRQTYHAMVKFADAAVGNVTRSLKASGMYESTLIVFTGDNVRQAHTWLFPRTLVHLTWL